MREVGVDSRRAIAPPDAVSVAPTSRSPVRSESPAPVPQAMSPSEPALMLPPRLGILRAPPGHAELAVRRLVVPVPSSDLDEAVLGSRIWEIAMPADLPVLFLARVDGPDVELQIRRRLTTLAALLRRRQGSVETFIAHDRSWIAAIRRVRAPGDAIVCAGGESAPAKSRERSLAGRVVEELRMPAYVVENLPLDLADRPRVCWSGFLTWVAPLLLLAAFGVLQIQVVIQVHGWVQTMLLLMTVGLELAALWFVESVVGTWR